MMRVMCGQKVVDRKTTEEQMDMLGLKETIDLLATANGLDQWFSTFFMTWPTFIGSLL